MCTGVPCVARRSISASSAQTIETTAPVRSPNCKRRYSPPSRRERRSTARTSKTWSISTPSVSSLTSMLWKVMRSADGTRRARRGEIGSRRGDWRPVGAGTARARRGALRLKTVGAAVQERDLAHVVLPQHLHQQTCQTKAEAAVRGCAVAEEVKVVLDRLDLDLLLLRLRDELLVAVLALCPCGELDAAPKQVEALCERRPILMTHVVKRPHRGWVVRDEHELATGLLGDDRRQRPLAWRIEVVIGAGHVVAVLCQQRLRVGERDAREGHSGRPNIDAERARDLLAVLASHGGEHVREPALLKGHHVL